jgi:putative membrane protein
MSYLDDPRVFLAIERTHLAWFRTNISLLAIAFLIKKFGEDGKTFSGMPCETMISTLCLTSIVLSLLSLIQTWISLSKLSKIEIPGPLAKPIVLFSGFIATFICVGSAYILNTF